MAGAKKDNAWLFGKACDVMDQGSGIFFLHERNGVLKTRHSARSGGTRFGILVLLSFLIVIACGKDSSTAPGTSDPGNATKIAVTPISIAPLTAPGQTVQLSAVVTDQNGNTMTGVAVTWTSSDPQVATVSASGLVAAAGSGTVVIIATIGSLTDAVQVTVALSDEREALIRLYNATGGPDWTENTHWLSERPLQEWYGVGIRNGRVVDLALINNNLTGVIPPELGRLTLLEGLYLGANQLEGAIPPELGRLTSLRSLWLDTNQLEGAIPPELGQSAGLESLKLDGNRLAGAIPSQLGRLSELEELHLQNNLLTGEIPSALADLRNLKSLRLENNAGLSGPLPARFIDLRLLGTLYLGGTGACAPPDAELQAWLSALPNRYVASCVTVDPGRSAAYLTQATQSFSDPVPLVAGERALLRVFVVSDADGATVPPVRATFYRGGAEVHVVNVAGSDGRLPTRIDEGTLSASVNAEVPGHVVAPGLEMVVEIDPEGAGGSAPGMDVRLPATGRTSVDVKEVPPFDLTLVPFLWEEDPDRSVLTRVEGLTAESDLLRATRDLLPIGDFRLTVRDYVLSPADPLFDNAGELGPLLEMTRAMDGASGHYLGILRGYGGLGQQPGYTSLAGLDEVTIAHELGHNMNLEHAPCGIDISYHVYYPHADGSTGSWGYDFLAETLVSPDTPDLMGYCEDPWIGAYSFTRALEYRHAYEGREAPAAASSRGLLLWGGLDESGDLFLEPAFVVDAPPSPAPANGPYRLEGESAGGAARFTLDFAMPAFVDHPDEGVGAFAFVLPMRSDWGRRLARITLSGPEGVVELNGEGDPSALLLDAVSGRVRGFLRDWPAPGASGLSAARRVLPEPGLEVLISRGLP